MPKSAWASDDSRNCEKLANARVDAAWARTYRQVRAIMHLSLVEPHTARVVTDRCWPVREQADELDVLGEHVQRLVHVAVLPDCGAGRIEIVVGAHAGCAPAQVDALEAPADEVEAQ